MKSPGWGYLALVAEEQPAAGEDVLHLPPIDVWLDEYGTADQAPIRIHQALRGCCQGAPPARLSAGAGFGGCIAHHPWGVNRRHRTWGRRAKFLPLASSVQTIPRVPCANAVIEFPIPHPSQGAALDDFDHRLQLGQRNGRCRSVLAKPVKSEPLWIIQDEPSRTTCSRCSQGCGCRWQPRLLMLAGDRVSPSATEILQGHAPPAYTGHPPGIQRNANLQHLRTEWLPVHPIVYPAHREAEKSILFRFLSP